MGPVGKQRKRHTGKKPVSSDTQSTPPQVWTGFRVKPEVMKFMVFSRRIISNLE